MTAVVFRSRLRPHADEDCAERPLEMFGYASKMPGFRSMKGYTANDGESLTLVEFDTTEQLEAWPKHAAYLHAQHEARDRFYSPYRLQVCERVQTSEFGSAEQ